MESLSDITKSGVSAFAPGGSGSAVSGNSVVNFGVYPGSQEASVVITGQAGIVSGSVLMASIRHVESTDHTADEHMRESLRVVAGNIVAGTGFTIYVFKDSRLDEQDTFAYGQWNVSWIWI